MLQGMAGEQLTLEPGDLYETTAAQAKIWAEHGVAKLVKPAPQRQGTGLKPRPTPAEPRSATQTPPRTTRIDPKPK